MSALPAGRPRAPSPDSVREVLARLATSPDSASQRDIEILNNGYTRIRVELAECQERIVRADSDRLHMQIERAHSHEQIERSEQKREQEVSKRIEAVHILITRLPHFSRYCQTRPTPLPLDSLIACHLRQEFLRSVKSHSGPRRGDSRREVPQFDVIRIEQLFCARLQEKYIAEVQDEAGLCEQRATQLELSGDGFKMRAHTFAGMNMNEFMLFHGAPSHLYERLQRQGLDPRYAGNHFGKLFGIGVYLASHSSKSDIYTEPNPQGERLIFVVRACLGEPYFAATAMRDALKPPERPDGRGPLTSVVARTSDEGGVVQFPEYIVYEKSKVLPQYAIWYKHLDACYCTHCVRSKVRVVNGLTRDVITVNGVSDTTTAYDIKVKVMGSEGIDCSAQCIYTEEGEELGDNAVASSWNEGLGCQLTMRPHILWRVLPTPSDLECICKLMVQGHEFQYPCFMARGVPRSVAALKTRITEISGVPPHRQRLLFQGRALEAGSLAENCVATHSVVHLSIRERVS